MSDTVFVATQWLRDHINDAEIVVMDVREPYFYTQSHLPNSVNFPAVLLQSRSGVPPSPDYLSERLGAIGISRTTHIILYDQGASAPAAQVYWLLDWIGHPHASILDGGITRWRHEGLDVDYVPTSLAPTTYEPAETSPEVLARLEDVRAAIGDPDSIILDVRAPAEYLGLQTTALRDGHVPSALNLEWANALQRDSNEIAALMPKDELRILYETAGVTTDKQVIVHCQTGARSSVTYAVLKSLGYDRVRHYTAGWQEWGNRDDTPVEGE